MFTADDVRHRLETDGHPPPVGGAVFLALAARSRRTLKVGKRAVPLALAAKLGADVVSSFRLGAYELELLASLVVNRLRKAGLPVDPRLVQRVTVNAYLAPRRRHDVSGRRRTAAGAARGDVERPGDVGGACDRSAVQGGRRSSTRSTSSCDVDRRRTVDRADDARQHFVHVELQALPALRRSACRRRAGAG